MSIQDELKRNKEPESSTGLMPVLFLAHGSPMNAIEDNEFSYGWKNAAKSIEKPSAILCISAHWETRGTHITAMERPTTIHDFGGFPEELYMVQYPAPGNPGLAKEIKGIFSLTEADLDEKRGLDHGCWSVVKQMYPEADIPVLQLSLDYYADARRHYELAAELAVLRKKGVLIIGSGNMVHNLGMAEWAKLNDTYGFDWALEAGEKMKKFILSGDHGQLLNYRSVGKSFDLAIPTPEHYLPMLYVLSLQDKNDRVSLFNDKTVGGSISMTCIRIDSD
ncbi:MAG TPA: 4,5-DOPA dioxygenase extradiol [Bacteroidales bacterium]|jgi:4,5-DOPA dioxygenase extradiol|nr:4,5-DOPA dioxygenase extradiol [Bacteroidales bacterium]